MAEYFRRVGKAVEALLIDLGFHRHDRGQWRRRRRPMLTIEAERYPKEAVPLTQSERLAERAGVATRPRWSRSCRKPTGIITRPSRPSCSRRQSLERPALQRSRGPCEHQADHDARGLAPPGSRPPRSCWRNEQRSVGCTWSCSSMKPAGCSTTVRSTRPRPRSSTAGWPGADPVDPSPHGDSQDPPVESADRHQSGQRLRSGQRRSDSRGMIPRPRRTRSLSHSRGLAGSPEARGARLDRLGRPTRGIALGRSWGHGRSGHGLPAKATTAIGPRDGQGAGH